MPRVHFLNVNHGDCAIIEHLSGHVTVIDVCAAEKVGEPVLHMSMAESLVQYSKSAGVPGNFNRRKYPDNPIAYMKDRGLTSVFRFISKVSRSFWSTTSFTQGEPAVPRWMRSARLVALPGSNSRCFWIEAIENSQSGRITSAKTCPPLGRKKSKYASRTSTNNPIQSGWKENESSPA